MFSTAVSLRVVKSHDCVVKSNNKCCFLYIPWPFLSNDKILDWSKLKAIADDKINVTEKIKFVLRRVENIVEKGENAGYQYFFLFQQCFQKVSCFKVIKSRACKVKS